MAVGASIVGAPLTRRGNGASLPRMTTPRAGFVDALQFCNWSRTIFGQMREAGLSAVHATVAYHEGFRPTVDRIVAWNARFRDHADLILPGRSAADLMRALSSNRTAIILGLQNPLPIEDDLGLVAVLHELGIRVMQLTYNNQSLLGCGWQEAEDGGLTRMGREVIREMNRLGMLIDLSHAGERTALEAIAASKRPVAITHATPAAWRPGGRQVSDAVLRALADSGGMLGLSLYPLHLRDGSATTLAAFCEMAARTAEIVGVPRLGIGSDLCQDQPDATLVWMREGKWMRPDPARPPQEFPSQPSWFQDSRGFSSLAEGLRGAGFAPADVEAILGTNWQRFFRAAFRPAFEAA
jgi:microsomal dipeptidase-like Zn-dependent dipeptidase